MFLGFSTGAMWIRIGVGSRQPQIDAPLVRSTAPPHLCEGLQHVWEPPLELRVELAGGRVHRRVDLHEVVHDHLHLLLPLEQRVRLVVVRQLHVHLVSRGYDGRMDVKDEARGRRQDGCQGRGA
eukprot:1179209-Prorocentrum_minimum.AAC.7